MSLLSDTMLRVSTEVFEKSLRRYPLQDTINEKYHTHDSVTTLFQDKYSQAVVAKIVVSKLNNKVAHYIRVGLYAPEDIAAENWKETRRILKESWDRLFKQSISKAPPQPKKPNWLIRVVTATNSWRPTGQKVVNAHVSKNTKTRRRDAHGRFVKND